MPKTNPATLRAIQKYKRDTVAEIRVYVKKELKPEIKAHATGQGESLNAFVNRAINETLERDRQKNKPPEGG